MEKLLYDYITEFSVQKEAFSEKQISYNTVVENDEIYYKVLLSGKMHFIQLEEILLWFYLKISTNKK